MAFIMGPWKLVPSVVVAEFLAWFLLACIVWAVRWGLHECCKSTTASRNTRREGQTTTIGQYRQNEGDSSCSISAGPRADRAGQGVQLAELREFGSRLGRKKAGRRKG